MINVSEDYKNACKQNVFNSYVVAKIGFYDKEAKGSISSSSSSNETLFSDLSRTYNDIKATNKNYISCEPNRVKLDGSFVFINFLSGTTENEEVAYWSGSISDENGNFTNINISIEYTFSKQIEFTYLTLYFQEVCSDLDIEYYLNNELLYTREIRNNKALIFETIDMSNTNPIAYYDKIVIRFLKTKEPYRRVKFNEVDFGSYEIIRKDKIVDLNIIKECSPDSSDLPSTSCNITIRDDNGDYDILNPNNKLRFLQERQEISLYHYLKVKNEYKEVSLGTFYLKNFNYSNRKLELECYDILYFMNKTYYVSPFYMVNSATAIITDIFNKMNLDSKSYNISSEFNKIYLSGYIPIVSFKEALRIVAEACCAKIFVDNYGIIKIFKDTTDNSSIAKDFQLKEISESQPTQNSYTKVIDITEHKYAEQFTNVEIYKGKLLKGEYIIQFTKFPIIYNMYREDFNLLKVDDYDKDYYNILSLGACACTIEVLTDNITVNLVAKIYNDSKSIKRFEKTNLNSSSEGYSISKIDNNFIVEKSTSSQNRPDAEKLADWKLNRNDVSYSFKSNIIPYLELGDKCSQEIPYKDTNGNYIRKTFEITKLELNIGIKQNIGGE